MIASPPPLRLRLDPALPITAQHDAITALLRVHPVLLVAGETGSGKSTQLPQYCLEIGRGTAGLIAHTQPRRIAARVLASRIAEEIGEPLGQTVGFRVRFADQVSARTRLTLMTDGLLLAELASDPLLRAYDTVIVDEAHERSLNVDLLLGALKRIRLQRPELQLIITSATLDVERMARFFDAAPVVTVSGRGYPIEVRYSEPLPEGEEIDLPAAVLEAYQQLRDDPAIGGGDVLVFLPGEREIMDVAELLEKEAPAGTEVLPLFARLDWERQSRILRPGGARRIVLATNVAETSITVPGIRAVIDSGLARVSRYSVRNRLQRLPIEPVSQASADQRKGRCGRLGPGVCVRLYSEDDYAGRPLFTPPEVLRTNLAALLLRLAADALGAAEEFPFIDPPDRRALNDGYRLLQELDALDAEHRITRRGRALARLPLDPRLARALLESKRFRAEGELLAIVSGLSVPDVRIGKPGADAEDAIEAVALEDTRSEFLSLVKLWRAYGRARAGSRRDLRRWAKERQLSLQRLSEWENVYAQVKDRAAEMGIVPRTQPASYTAVHRALLAGFCTMVGQRGEEGLYLGTRGLRFAIFPGSPLKRRKPRWIMAANIVETSRVFARRVAEIEPAWIEAAAEHLIRREYLEPDWDERREEVVARERTTFLGLVLRNDRRVNYGPIAPEDARQIFAREALVHGRYAARPAWLRENDAAVAAAHRVEERLRSRDLVVAGEALVAFYVSALPRQVSSAATLDYFTRGLDAGAMMRLRMTDADLFVRPPDPAVLAQFPEHCVMHGLGVPIHYRFAPGESDDGAVLSLPLLLVPKLTRADLERAVPGYIAPRLEALLRSLPKDARRRLIPMVATAADFTAACGAPGADPQRLRAWLHTERQLPEALIRFDEAAIPAFLSPRLEVVTEEGTSTVAATELPSLRVRLTGSARRQLDLLAAREFTEPWRRFALDTLPEMAQLAVADGTLTVHPTLWLDRGQVRVRYEWSLAEAQHALEGALPALAGMILDRAVKDLVREVHKDTALVLLASPYLRGDELARVLVGHALWRACFADRSLPRSRHEFEAAVEAGRGRVTAAAQELRTAALGWFTAARSVREFTAQARLRGRGPLAEDTEQHLRQLLGYATLSALRQPWLNQLPRYLKAEQRRWQRLAARGDEPVAVLDQLQHWQRRRAERERRIAAEQRWLAELDELRWWLEEYRVSLYAQDLKTLVPVSPARLEERVAVIDAWLNR